MENNNMIRLAVAKGRVAKEAVKLLGNYGIEFAEDVSTTRKLIIPDTTGRYEIVLVKPADAPIYVEQGVCDCGIVGRDIITENDSDVFVLFSLDIGKCSLCVAGKEGTDYRNIKNLRVASKFVNSAKAFLDSQGIEHSIIRLNGSVELAPILDMSDVIVDIVETGTTLRENGLVVLEKINDISSVFIVNKAALKTKYKDIKILMDILRR